MAFAFNLESCINVIESIESTYNGIKQDIENFIGQVKALKDKIDQLKAEKQGILSELPYMTTDDEGNEVLNEEKNNWAQGRIVEIEKEIADAVLNCDALEKLIRALSGKVPGLEKVLSGFTNASNEAQAAIKNSVGMLATGTSWLGKTIAIFNVPGAKTVGDWVKGVGNNAFEAFTGVKLSDVIDTGAKVFSGFTNSVLGQWIPSTPIGETGLDLLGRAVKGGEKLWNDFKDTAAETFSGVIVSGLNFFGVKKPEEKETVEAGTGEVETILEGNKADINTGKNESNTVTENQQAKLSPEQLANEIWAGKWGNGNSRKEALKAAGYTDSEISEAQKLVNKGISSKEPSRTAAEIMKDDKRTAAEIMKDDNEKGRIKTDYYKGKAAKK